MHYHGKTVDTFEPAIFQLMEWERITGMGSPDCISLRAFGFCADGGKDRWFRPFISTAEAVQSLRKVTDVPLKILYLRPEELQSEELPEAFVLGALNKGIAPLGVREYYYSGEGRYLFVRRKKGRYEVFDPCGFPGLWMKKEEFSALFGDDNVGCIYIEKNGKKAAIQLDSAMLLERGLKYHESIRVLEEQSILAACLGYKDTVGGRIAFRWGVVGMIQMFDKVFALAEKCGYNSQIEYVSMKQHFYRLAESGKSKELPGMLTCLWRSFEAYGR